MIALVKRENQRKIFGMLFQPHFWRGFWRGTLLGLGILVVGGYAAFRFAYAGRIMPGVTMSGVNVAGKTPVEALYLIDRAVDDYVVSWPTAQLVYGDEVWELPTTSLNLRIDEVAASEALVGVGRKGNWLEVAKTQYDLLLGNGTDLPATLQYDEVLLSDFVATAAGEIDNPAIPPRVYVGQTYNPKTASMIYVEEGVAGEVVLTDEVMRDVVEALTALEPITVLLKTREESFGVSEEKLQEAQERAKKLVDKSLTLYYENDDDRNQTTWKLEGADLVSFLSVRDGFDQVKITNYLASVEQAVNRPAQSALFEFDASMGKVVEFKPAKKGLAVSIDLLALSIEDALAELVEGKNVEPVLVRVSETEPSIDTAAVNDLGIETLIGRGESTYFGSIASRKHNVELAAKKLHGLLVAPGETFSFNQALGEVSSQTGFLQAYIIKDGRTILGDGGGVCQDSTTLFRAVLDAGLPISEWRNHSYRVSYYEQNTKPGFDATVYSPTTDLKFVNDTPGHILIQTKAENMTLVYELYGSDDGREAVIDNYAQWDAVPPPPDLHQDDPSLPAGTVKQIERAIPGLKTKFDYTVTREGEVIYEKTFVSVFRPWQAVYLHGTKLP